MYLYSINVILFILACVVGGVGSYYFARLDHANNKDLHQLFKIAALLLLWQDIFIAWSMADTVFEWVYPPLAMAGISMIGYLYGKTKNSSRDLKI